MGTSNTPRGAHTINCNNSCGAHNFAWFAYRSVFSSDALSHKRYKFDFAVLLAEVVRHELSISPLRRCFFVDTLVILDAARREIGPCMKLQCLARHFASSKELRAHRASAPHPPNHAKRAHQMDQNSVIYLLRTLALDDCVALRHVMDFLAARLGICVVDLHRQFAVRIDEPASVSQIQSILVD